jgi:hypothetical protein
MEGVLGRGLKSDPNPLVTTNRILHQETSLQNRLAAKEAGAHGEADSLSFKSSKVRFNFA